MNIYLFLLFILFFLSMFIKEKICQKGLFVKKFMNNCQKKLKNRTAMLQIPISSLNKV